MLDQAAFRAAFPEFADTTVYPTAMVNFWLNVSAQMVGTVWGTMQTQGSYLYAAHSLLLASREAKGGGGGLVSSKSVGGVSVSYDTGNIVEQGAGQWNATVYGRQYYRLVRIFGAGAIPI